MLIDEDCGKEYNSRLNRALDYLNANLGGDISLDVLARGPLPPIDIFNLAL